MIKQLLTIEALDMMWCQPESTNVDICSITVIFGTLRLKSHQSKKGGKDQESIKSSTTRLYITSQSQEVSPFPAGDHKAAVNRRESMTNTRHINTKDPQKKYLIGKVSKNILLEGYIFSYSGHLKILGSDSRQNIA